jgi:hypothetical protein
MNVTSQRRDPEPKTVTVGFAAHDGRGIAYAVAGNGGRGSGVRVGFTCRPLPALRGREAAYAALEAVAEEFLERGVQRVVFRIDDEQLPADLAQRRSLPNALVVPYVKLRCVLNRFHEARIERATGGIVRDATARARAELWLTEAA